MADHAAAGMPAIRLQPAHQEAGRTRGDDDLGRKRGVEPGQQRALQFLALGRALLDEIGADQRRLRLGMKRHPVSGHLVRKRLRGGEPDQRRPCACNELAQCRLRPRRRVAGRHRQAAGQKVRSPAGADRASPDHGNVSNPGVLHDRPPAAAHRPASIGAGAFVSLHRAAGSGLAERGVGSARRRISTAGARHSPSAPRLSSAALPRV